jgi:hypothetical protein
VSACESVLALMRYSLPCVCGQARVLIDSALEVDAKDKTAVCLSATWELQQGNLEGAAALYKRVLNEDAADKSSKDSYCKLMQGVVCLMKADAHSNNKRRLESLTKAGSWFSSVLTHNHKNKFAALGMGVVLAKMGKACRIAAA